MLCFGRGILKNRIFSILDEKNKVYFIVNASNNKYEANVSTSFKNLKCHGNAL
jgi:hypothetical protein